MRNIVIADSHRHANAVITWLGLDTKVWSPIKYGERISGKIDYVKLVRPLSDMTEAHVDWYMQDVSPLIFKDVTLVPSSWTLSVAEVDDLDDPVSFQLPCDC